MPHNDLEDLTLFPFEKNVEEAPEVLSSNCLLEQMKREEETFSKSHHCGTNVKLLVYFTTVSMSTASTIIAISRTTTMMTTVILLESL